MIKGAFGAGGRKRSRGRKWGCFDWERVIFQDFPEKMGLLEVGRRGIGCNAYRVQCTLQQRCNLHCIQKCVLGEGDFPGLPRKDGALENKFCGHEMDQSDCEL